MLPTTDGFHALFHSPLLGNVLLDDQMRIVAFNQSASETMHRLFALEMTEGASFLRYIPTEAERDRLIIGFQQALSGIATGFSINVTDSTGAVVKLKGRCIPIDIAAARVCISYYPLEELPQQLLTVGEQYRELSRSETIFRSLFDNHPYANLFISAESKLLAINKKAIALLKRFDLDLSINTTDVLARLVQSPFGEIAALIWDALQNKTVVVTEKELLDAAGREHWIAFHLIPTIDEAGNVLGIHVQMRDTSQQKKIQDLMRLQQERLRQSESQLQAVFASSSDINIFIGTDYRIISFNKEAVDVFLKQVQKRLLPGLDIRTLHFWADETSFEQDFQLALKGQIVTKEVKFDKHKSWYRFSYTPVIDRMGVTIGVIVNGINISERKHNEEKLLIQNEQIKEFAFLTAHRLRAPLASILGLINVFEMDLNMSREDTEDLIRRLRSASEELNYVVSEMNRSLEPLQINQSAEIIMSSVPVTKSVPVINNTARPPSIMLIDDDPIVNMVSKTLLQRSYPGIIIHTFLKAEDALQFLKTTKEQPALILLDVVMPEMNGWQFLAAFEQLDYKPPVCMLSSSLRKSDHEEAKKYASVIDFIIKPLDAEKIKNVMQFLKATQ
ncbi:response regulator [Rhodoflexus sp.]